MTNQKKYRFPLSHRLICSESRLVRTIGYKLHQFRLFFDPHYAEEDAASYHLWRLDREPGYRKQWEEECALLEQMILKGRNRDIIIPRGSALHQRLQVVLSAWEAALIAEPSLEEPEDEELLELIGTEEAAE